MITILSGSEVESYVPEPSAVEISIKKVSEIVLNTCFENELSFKGTDLTAWHLDGMGAYLQTQFLVWKYELIFKTLQRY